MLSAFTVICKLQFTFCFRRGQSELYRDGGRNHGQMVMTSFIILIVGLFTITSFLFHRLLSPSLPLPLLFPSSSPPPPPPPSLLSLFLPPPSPFQGHYSTVTIELKQEYDCTKLELSQTKVPDSDSQRTMEGWKRYIFENIKTTFGFGARLL